MAGAIPWKEKTAQDYCPDAAVWEVTNCGVWSVGTVGGVRTVRAPVDVLTWPQ